MRYLKKLLLLLLLLIAVNSLNAQTSNYIDSLRLLPQNPTDSGIIKVVCYTYFPASDCSLDSSTININNFQISVFAYYTIGMLGTPCQSIDTLTIGNLNYGNYKLIYNYTVNINSDSITGSDSLYFTVSLTNSLPEEKKTELSIKIYPNPASDIITLNINYTNNADMSLNIYTVIGKLISSELLKQNQQKINIGVLNNGIYLVEIKSKDWTEKQKLIIQK